MKFQVRWTFVFSFLALFICGGLGSGSIFAYTTVSRTQARASADLSRVQGSADLTVTFHKIADDSEVLSADKVSWDNLEAAFENDPHWLAAATYAKITTKMSMRGAAIQIYTDNTNKLEYNGALPSPLYSMEETQRLFGLSVSTLGLYPVSFENGQPSAVGPAIPLAWRVAPEKLSGNDLRPVTRLNGLQGSIELEGGPAGYHPWFFMTDLSQKYAGEGGDMGLYAKLSRAGLGLQVSESTFFNDNDNTHYLYFAADFSHALGNTTYKANIVIEAFVE